VGHFASALSLRSISNLSTVEMIVKVSILGMLVVLVAVLVVSMRFRESFADAPIAPVAPQDAAKAAQVAPQVVPPQVGPSVPQVGPSVPQVGPSVPLPRAATLQVGDKPQAGVFIPSQPSDIKASTLLPPSLGAAGPAPVDSIQALSPSPALLPSPSQAPEASAIKNQSDLLANIQKVIHNELLANRAMDTSVHATSQAASSPSLTQGREHQKAAPAAAAGSAHAAGCSGEPCTCDQSEYIKKDSIPCWGCALDY
jgi:hypothetical protein